MDLIQDCIHTGGGAAGLLVTLKSTGAEEDGDDRFYSGELWVSSLHDII